MPGAVRSSLTSGNDLSSIAVLVRWFMPLVAAPPLALTKVTEPNDEAAGEGGLASSS
jgi:hypothetical protein